MSTSHLSIANVTKRFGSHQALDGVSLDVAAGEGVVILGTKRLRQDDAAAPHRRARGSRCWQDLDIRRAGIRPKSQSGAASQDLRATLRVERARLQRALSVTMVYSPANRKTWLS